MKVFLKRNLFLGGNRYRADPNGTEVPDKIEGKKVVLWNKAGHEEDEIPLPKDCVLFDEKKAPKEIPKKPTPKALSELNKETPNPLSKL